MKAACICAECHVARRGLGLRYSKPNRAEALISRNLSKSNQTHTDNGLGISTVERQKRSSSQAHNAARCACEKRAETRLPGRRRQKRNLAAQFLQVGFNARPRMVSVRPGRNELLAFRAQLSPSSSRQDGICPDGQYRGLRR